MGTWRDKPDNEWRTTIRNDLSARPIDPRDLALNVLPPAAAIRLPNSRD